MLRETMLREKRQTNAFAAVLLRLRFNLTDSNMIGAPLASYLLHNETRFKTFHSCKYILMYDIEALLEGHNVSKYRYNRRYTTNNAYDYLCCLVKLEDFSARSWLPDTAEFCGSINRGTINATTEVYCQRALMLCVP